MLRRDGGGRTGDEISQVLVFFTLGTGAVIAVSGSVLRAGEQAETILIQNLAKIQSVRDTTEIRAKQ